MRGHPGGARAIAEFQADEHEQKVASFERGVVASMVLSDRNQVDDADGFCPGSSPKLDQTPFHALASAVGDQPPGHDARPLGRAARLCDWSIACLSHRVLL